MTWSIENGMALANQGGWNAQLTPSLPTKGLVFSQVDCAAWKAFSVKPLPKHSLQLIESYVRGTDLITRFAQNANDQFAFQLDWRLLEENTGTTMGIELWISIQTDLLNSLPVLVVSCESLRGEYWEILDQQAITGEIEVEGEGAPTMGPAALVSRAVASTAVWLIEPTDRRNVEVQSSPGEPEQRLELFSHFMEKGVIRRARMRFHVVDGNLSSTTLKELYRDFSQSPLPLTA